MNDPRMNEWMAAYTKPYGIDGAKPLVAPKPSTLVAYAKPWKVRDVPNIKETRESPEVVLQYAFGEYGMDNTKDTFSAAFWKPTSK